ncbi:hypothetical protein PCE1_004184 [Barthelona sp. PCE]
MPTKNKRLCTILTNYANLVRTYIIDSFQMYSSTLLCVVVGFFAVVAALNTDYADLLTRGYTIDEENPKMALYRGSDYQVFKEENPHFKPDAANDDTGPMAFIPNFLGNLMPSTSRHKLVPMGSGKCFEEIKMSLILNEEKAQMNLRMVLGYPKGFTCTDHFLFLTLSDYYTSLARFRSGVFDIVLKGVQKSEFKYIRENGLVVFAASKGIFGTISSLYSTARLFIGSQTEENVIKHMRSYGFKLEKRHRYNIPFPKERLRSGDVFFLFDPSGIDALIGQGTASLIGHVGIVVENEQGVKEVCESVSYEAFVDPAEAELPTGIICTEYIEFMKLQETSRHIVIGRLKDELSEKFISNIEKVRTLYRELKTPYYGYEGLFGSFIDVPGDANMPFGTTEMLGFIIRAAHSMKPEVIDLLFKQGIAWRLGFDHDVAWDFDDLMIYTQHMKKQLGEIMAVVENQGRKYTKSNGDQVESMICSAFVMRMLQAGGVFGDLEFNAPETTPADLSYLDIFDKDIAWPAEFCTGTERGYCQFWGALDFDLPHFSTIKPYAHMNERCPTDRFHMKC